MGVNSSYDIVIWSYGLYNVLGLRSFLDLWLFITLGLYNWGKEYQC